MSLLLWFQFLNSAHPPKSKNIQQPHSIVPKRPKYMNESLAKAMVSVLILGGMGFVDAFFVLVHPQVKY